MKVIYTFLSFFLFFTAFAQDVSGYYIASGNRIEGHFKKSNFRDFKSLEFKKGEYDSYAALNQDLVTEYGVEGRKFIKATVDVDITGGSVISVAVAKEPVFEKRTVFLEVLVESNASLYVYEEGANARYFFKVNDKNKEIKQLVYKKYYYSQTTVAENAFFRQQLAIDVLCPDASASRFTKTAYNKSALTDVFQDYNNCTGFTSVVGKETTEKVSSVGFAVVAGAGIASTSGEVPSTFVVKSNGAAYYVGGEAILSIKYSGFSMFGRITVQKFSGDGNNQRPLGSSYVEKNSMKVDITELNFNVGGRYTFEISGKDRIFLEASLLVAAPLSSSVEASYGTYAPLSNTGESTNVTLKPKSNLWANVGAGVCLTKKLSVGVYCTPRRSLFTINDFRSTIFTGGLTYKFN